MRKLNKSEGVNTFAFFVIIIGLVVFSYSSNKLPEIINFLNGNTRKIKSLEKRVDNLNDLLNTEVAAGQRIMFDLELTLETCREEISNIEFDLDVATLVYKKLAVKNDTYRRLLLKFCDKHLKIKEKELCKIIEEK